MAKSVKKIEDKENKMIFKVTKSYSRKVSLKGITSQYDNIDCGTFVTAIMECENIEEFDDKCKTLFDKVRTETERDIATSLRSLMDTAKEPENSALVGMGDDISDDSYETIHIEGLDEIGTDQTNKEIVSLDDFEEIDINDV